MITLILKSADKSNNEVWENDTLVLTADSDTAIEAAGNLAINTNQGFTLKSQDEGLAWADETYVFSLWRDAWGWHYAENNDEVYSTERHFSQAICSINDRLVEQHPDKNFSVEIALP